MKKNKVALIADFDKFGGTKTYFILLSKLLVEKLPTDNLVLYTNKKENLSKNEYSYFINNKIKIFNLPSYLKDNKFTKKIKISLLIELYYFITLRFKKFNKVIISTGFGQKYLSGSVIFGSNFFFIQHTYLGCYNFGKKTTFHDINSIIKKRILSTNYVHITVSEYSKKIIEKNYNNINTSSKTIVIYNPVNIISNKKFKNNNFVIISTFGHMEDYKNPYFWLDTAIEVVKKHKNVVFLWAGNGSLFAKIKELIPFEFKSQILLLGIVSDVSKILEKTSIYFQPSKIESHGISVIDAMSFSIPCITSRAGGLPESVINNKTGYTIDLSLEQSVEKIEKLMFDKNLSEKFGKEAKKVVDEKFSYNKWRADILNALRLNDEQ